MRATPKVGQGSFGRAGIGRRHEVVAAAQHGGVDVDLLDEVVWWQTDDFWSYAVYAAIAYIRLAADRAGVPEVEVCPSMAQKPLP